VNTSQTNFHGANAVVNISTAWDNLAMARQPMIKI
jgi:uncharacterized protein YbjQ (UPF0145 family)